jgi:trimethylamine corrinoid protein
MSDNPIFQEAKNFIISQDKEKVAEITKKFIEDGGDPMEIMNNAFIPGINKVGDLFGRGQLFLPELMLSADAMLIATELVNKALEGTEGAQKSGGIIVLATVKGDVHDIGKCIVVSLMKANGFTVHDLGRDVDVDRIIEEAVKVEADVIGTSALLTTTMKQQKVLEEALKTAGLKGKIKTVVGGAPVTPRWAARIGADGYAEDAQDGIVKIKEMLA